MIFLTILRNPFNYLYDDNDPYWKTLSSNENIQYLLNKTVSVYDFSIVRPLAKLYLYGPRFGGYGFWQGMADTDICTALNSGHNPSSFWSKNIGECHDMIARDFNAWLVFVEFLVTVMVLYITLKYLKRFGISIFHGLSTCLSWLLNKLSVLWTMTIKNNSSVSSKTKKKETTCK